MHDLYISNVFSYVARKSWWLSFQNKKLQLIIYFGAWNLVQAWHWTPQKNRIVFPLLSGLGNTSPVNAWRGFLSGFRLVGSGYQQRKKFERAKTVVLWNSGIETLFKDDLVTREWFFVNSTSLNQHLLTNTSTIPHQPTTPRAPHRPTHNNSVTWSYSQFPSKTQFLQITCFSGFFGHSTNIALLNICRIPVLPTINQH